jgi:2-oxoisovalerate ferredoxin oxidoreductase beta subunit
VISGEEIGSPVVYEPDVLVAFNRPSLEKFANDVKQDGVILYDSSIGDYDAPEGTKAISVPATRIAKEAGSEKAANTAMLGVMMALGNTKLPDDTFFGAIEETFAGKPKLIPINHDVLKAAARWAEENI